MKCQSLFSWKNFINLFFAEFAKTVVKAKRKNMLLLGTNSFLLERTSFQKGNGANRKSLKLSSL